MFKREFLLKIELPDIMVYFLVDFNSISLLGVFRLYVKAGGLHIGVFVKITEFLRRGLELLEEGSAADRLEFVNLVHEAHVSAASVGHESAVMVEAEVQACGE
eukprot:CAMPEP_0116903734 /NCGR_PEP_ID=MMETSP0467-20121206/10934_1 /TAXON_ID=283647 /ORGANISM="Mesodinium pulex, Strain SPMC105" /LENGTH=102 /DNA_ID=CAMNT_0004578113 /DNA_START=2052 /DNA_END=2360 /DNA_ORIENTATION=-